MRKIKAFWRWLFAPPYPKKIRLLSTFPIDCLGLEDLPEYLTVPPEADTKMFPGVWIWCAKLQRNIRLLPGEFEPVRHG